MKYGHASGKKNIGSRRRLGKLTTPKPKSPTTKIRTDKKAKKSKAIYA
jgi:hypothetical protein